MLSESTIQNPKFNIPLHSNSRLQKYRLTAIGRATACEILNEQF
jgi:hypothetical protein